MVRTGEILIIGGVLVIVPLEMGGIPLIKLLFFALAVLIGVTGLCGTWLHSLARQIRTVSASAPCSQVPHCITLLPSRIAQSFFFAFFVVVFLSPLWSVAPILSIVGVEPRFEGVMTYMVFFGLALLAWGMARAGREQNFLRVILWSNVGVVSYGLLQLVGMDPFSGWWDADLFLGRVFSTVGQPNMLGQFLLLTGPLAVWTVRRWEASWVRGLPIIAGVLLALNLLVLLATGSRAAILGALVEALCVWACVTLSSSKGAQKDHGVSCFDGLSMTRLIVSFLIIFVVGLPIAFRRFTLPGEWERSVGGRIAIWRDAVTMVRARPFGWGLETTDIIFPRFQSSPLTPYESLTTSVDRAHSKPLDLLLTVGPLGLLSYYGFLTMLIIGALRAWRPHRDGLDLAGIVSLLGVSVSLLFGFEGIVVHAFFWLICGMLLGRFLSPVGRELESGVEENFQFSILNFQFLAITVVLLFANIATFFFAALSLSSRITANHAEQAFQRGDLVTAVQEYARATRQVPWDRALLIRFLETALLARERAEDQETEHAIDTVLEKHLHALRWLTSGSDPLLPSLQAWQAALQGEKKGALGFLEEEKARAPFSVPRLRIAVHIAELLGDKTMEDALRTELKNMLPSWWSNASDPRRRILLKENPWVGQFFPVP